MPESGSPNSGEPRSVSSPDPSPEPKEPAVPLSRGLVLAGVVALVLGVCAGILMSSSLLR